MTDELEEQYGFAAELAALSDEQLVARFNSLVGNRAWGNARAYFLHCLRSELHLRSVDSTCIVNSNGLRPGKMVRLADGKLHLAN